MCTGRKFQEDQALRNLLVIDDELNRNRYPLVELENQSDFLPSTVANTIAYQEKKIFKGKENRRQMKYLLPQLKSSKDELKLQLRKLQAKDECRQNDCSILETLLKGEKSCYVKPLEESHTVFKEEKKKRQKSVETPQIEKAPLSNYKREKVKHLMMSKGESANHSKKVTMSSQSLASKTLLILNQINAKKSRSIFDSCLKKKPGHSYSQAMRKKTVNFLKSFK